MSHSGVGLYGGSFNPIHLGHLAIARAVVDHFGLSRMVFLPAAAPPHKAREGLAPSHDRAEMVRLAIAGEPVFELSDFDLRRPGPCYTIDTVLHFRELLPPGTEIFWLIGADTLSELPTWKRIHELVDLCRIVTACRPGYDAINWHLLERVFRVGQVEKLRHGLVETPRVDISSTDIRRRVAASESIADQVPPTVAEYIQQNRLYASNPL